MARISDDDGDEGQTRQTALPSPSPDEQPTGAIADVGIVAELRAVLTSGERKVLPLYTLADQIVVGRGTASDWQLDDTSLSRRHAQFKWTGQELTVEDLGSQNGTRVSGRPARQALPVRPGEAVQIGAVIVTLESRAGLGSPDEESTRLTPSPELASRDTRSPSAQGSSSVSRADANFPQLPGMATVVKPPRPMVKPIPEMVKPLQATGPSGAPQVFQPSKDAARADEPTRPWDPRAALVHPPERAFDGEMMERLREQWRENRRPFVLAGAALWIGILLTVWWIHDRAKAQDDFGASAPQVNAPRVTALSPPKPVENTPAPVEAQPVVDAERDEALERAVAAYDQGRMAEALAQFRRLAAADPKDPGFKFMVELIESRVHEGAKP